MNSPNILIATPAYGGAIKTGCVASLLRLQRALQDRGAQITFDFTSYADIASVRNIIGTLALENQQYSHVLFVDSDMVFSPATVLKLIGSNLPLIGCFYSSRKADGSVVGFVTKIVQVPESGLVEVDAIGMGLCLIDTECFRSLQRTGRIKNWVDHPFPTKVQGAMLGFFDREANGRYTSEDYAFCRRWRDLCGGKVWALVREDIGHVGDFEFKRRTDIAALVPLQLLDNASGAPGE